MCWDAKAIDELVRAVLAREPQAWEALQLSLIPKISGIARRHDSMRTLRLHLRFDDLQDVLTATLERLSRDEFRNLRRFLHQLDEPSEARPQSFESWLYGAVDYTIREHLRQRFGRRSRGADDRRALTNQLELRAYATAVRDDTCAHDCGSITGRVMVSQIITFAESTFSEQELHIFQLHLEGMDFEEIAAACNLSDRRASARIVRKLNARLRYRFARDLEVLSAS